MKKLLLIFLCFFAISSFSLLAQTFNGANGHIADNNTTQFTLNVSGLNPSEIDTANFGLEKVCIDIDHSWVEDLRIVLVAPDGQTVTLVNSIGGSENNFTGTCFLGDAETSINSGSAPFTGIFKPAGVLGLVNNGQTGNGTWKLIVTDQVNGDEGDVLGWSITFGNEPATYMSFSSSNLPLVIIQTNGIDIQDDPKIMADMGIIDNGPGQRNYRTDVFNDYNGKIGIEYRGSSSQTMPKKPYGFELWDVNGTAIDRPILGMPEESDWILSPAYPDKSLMRNNLVYRMWENMGYYGSRGREVEVILNDEYQGVYLLCEKIKRGGDRLDISKLQPEEIFGDDLTGGYILKVDKTTGNASPSWTSDFAPADNPGGDHPKIQIEYPKADDLVPQQFNYIKAYVDSFELALATIDFADTDHGYRHFINENSFLDYLLITEFNRNVDSYRISTFMYKDKNSEGGKLTMGPVWDYDLAFGNADYCEGWKTTGWTYDFGLFCGGDDNQVPFWWKTMMSDTLFTNNLRCRWEQLKPTVFDTVVVNNWIDSMAADLNESQQRNYAQWPILGIHIWPNFYVAQDYKGEVDTLKWWIKERFEWLDENIPGRLINCAMAGISELDAERAFSAYPNPFTDDIQLRFHIAYDSRTTIQLTNVLGEVVVSKTIAELHGAGDSYTIDTPAHCKPGIYFLSIQTGNGQRLVKKLVKS